MWGRSAGPLSQRRARRPGPWSSSRSIASSTVAASTSWCRSRPGKSGVSVVGRGTFALGSLHRRDLDRPDGRQVARDLAPAVALVAAREELAGARAEVEAWRVAVGD